MREIYFYEDDYCQQQLLPLAAADYAARELREIEKFANAHRAPGGIGWTNMYLRGEAPVEVRTLQIRKGDFAALVAPMLPEFDRVYTGYSSHQEVCKRTGAWGKSEVCALFADWGDDGIIENIWSALFERKEESIRAASKAIATLGKQYPLVYVDWAWGYSCEITNEEAFAFMLREKLNQIAENIKKMP